VEAAPGRVRTHRASIADGRSADSCTPIGELWPTVNDIIGLPGRCGPSVPP